MSLPTLKEYHKEPYPGINPSRPELSQAGRTVVITGGNGGIGFAAARAFMQADAARVIILARRSDRVQSAADELTAEAKSLNKTTIIQGLVCDVADLDSTKKLWSRLKADGIYVDVLVLNAASTGEKKPILESSFDLVWGAYETNLRPALDMTFHFYHQEVSGEPKQKFLINVSTIATYMWSTMAPEFPAYGPSKNSGMVLVQQMAKDTKPEDMQIVSFHPGAVLTEANRRSGYTDEMGLKWDDVNLPGQTTVWAASSEAEFLHGRFIWANWDVDEIKNGETGQQIAEDEHFLKVGIEGLTEKWGGMII